MAEFDWSSGSGIIGAGPERYSWRLVADDLTGKPIRFEITCDAPVRVTATISRGNSQNSFTRSMVFPVGVSTVDIPNNVANRIVCIDDTGDALLMVG